MEPSLVKSRLDHLKTLLDLPTRKAAVALSCGEPGLLQCTEAQLAMRHANLTTVLLKVALDVAATRHRSTSEQVGLELAATKRRSTSKQVISQLISRDPKILTTRVDVSALSRLRCPADDVSAGMDVLQLVWMRPQILAPMKAVKRAKTERREGLYTKQMNQQEALDLATRPGGSSLDADCCEGYLAIHAMVVYYGDKPFQLKFIRTKELKH
eukprot:gene31704-6909_t